MDPLSFLGAFPKSWSDIEKMCAESPLNLAEYRPSAPKAEEGLHREAVLRPAIAAPFGEGRAGDAPHPSRESLELLRACECPVEIAPLVHAVTLIPCCHKINQAVAETMYGRMAGESCERRGRPCVLCRAPVIAYYPDPVMRDVAHRALRLAELRVVAPRAVADAVPPPVVEPRVLPARRPAEARPEAELRIVAPRMGADAVPPVREIAELPFPSETLLGVFPAEWWRSSDTGILIGMIKECRNPVRLEILKTNLLVAVKKVEIEMQGDIHEYEEALRNKEEYLIARGILEQTRENLESSTRRLRAFKEIENFAK